jgi:hypothetical protein
MLVGDHPLAVDLTIANGRAHPGIAVFANGSLSADPVSAMGKGHVIVFIVRREGQVSDLIPNRTIERCEPFPQFFLYASAPAYRSGGRRSNNRTSGE